MKYLVIGALLGALTVNDVQALAKRGPIEHAAAVAAKSGADPSPDAEAAEAIKAEKDEEIKQHAIE